MTVNVYLELLFLNHPHLPVQAKGYKSDLKKDKGRGKKPYPGG